MVESSQCLVFAVKGDRYPCNHRTGIVEIDKSMSEKKRWVFIRQLNLQVRALQRDRATEMDVSETTL